MSAVKDLSPRAKRALLLLHEEYKAKVAPEGVRMPHGYYGRLASEYEQKVQQIIRGSFEDIENERIVTVKCPKCRQTGTLRGTQQRWTCCGQDYYTFATLVEG